MKQEIIEILGSNEMVKAVTSYNEQKAFNELVNEIIELFTTAPTNEIMEICEYCGEQLPTNCSRCESLISNQKEDNNE